MREGDMKMELKSNRNYGIDILRLVAMFQIVVLHSFTFGAIMGVQPFNIYYETGFLMEALVYSSVNCFALISGYVGAISKFKYRRIVKLLLQAVFYCLLITVVFTYIKPLLTGAQPSLTKESLIAALMPVKNNTYWYLTAYFATFFVAPFINEATRNITPGRAYAFILGIIFIAIAYPYFMKRSFFELALGYSATWIIIMYAVGGALSKTGIEKKVKNKYIFLALHIVMSVMAWGAKYISEYKSMKNGGFVTDGVYLQYTSIFIFLSAIFLVLFFVNVKVNNDKCKKVIQVLSPAAFGVYLIHVHPLFLQLPFWGRLTSLCQKPVIVMVLGVLLNAAAVFTICIIIELLRIRLFRLIGIDRIVDAAADGAGKIFNSLVNKTRKEK